MNCKEYHIKLIQKELKYTDDKEYIKYLNELLQYYKNI